MNWKLAIGYGVTIWVLMFAIVSIFVGYEAYDSSFAKAVIVVAAGAISFIFSRKIGPSSAANALYYGAVWVAAGLALDAIVTTRFAPHIFAAKSLWAGYLLVLLAPLLNVKKS